MSLRLSALYGRPEKWPEHSLDNEKMVFPELLRQGI